MPERNIKEVSVIFPAKDETRAFDSNGVLERVLAEFSTNFKPTLVLSVSNATGDFVRIANEFAMQDDRIHIVNLGRDPKGLANAYLQGYQEALDKEADFIVEMDANGAHDPSYIPAFLDIVDRGIDAALATRFSDGGAIDRYPVQRRLISQFGTIAANLVFQLDPYVPDMTSGYEAFNSETIRDLFRLIPPGQWISVTHGPGHFFQTEMRAMTIKSGHTYEMVPIVWGSERAQDPYKLPMKTVLKAFISLVRLKQREHQFSR